MVWSAVGKRLGLAHGIQVATGDAPDPIRPSLCARRPRLADRAFSLKQQCCPHCGRRGSLNRHSRILGNDPDHADRQRPRGQRAFCSDRGQRGGCGRTVAVCLAEVLPRHSVPAPLLAQLLAALLAGAALKAAAETLRTFFSVETFYRLRRKLRRRLDLVRSCLYRELTAPASDQCDPLLQTHEHLRAVFPAQRCPLTAFQLHFQQSLLG